MYTPQIISNSLVWSNVTYRIDHSMVYMWYTNECLHFTLQNAEIENLSTQMKVTVTIIPHNCYNTFLQLQQHGVSTTIGDGWTTRWELQTHFQATFPLPTFVNLMKPKVFACHIVIITKPMSSSLSVVTRPVEKEIVIVPNRSTWLHKQLADNRNWLSFTKRFWQLECVAL